MRWADIPFDASQRTLRQFAGLWLGALCALACYWGWWRGYPTTGWILAALAVTIGPLGLLAPHLIRPVWAASLIVTFPIGWLLSRVLLGVLYYGLFTPFALVFRLIGRDSLARHRRPTGETYWIPKPAITDLRRYYRQF